MHPGRLFALLVVCGSIVGGATAVPVPGAWALAFAFLSVLLACPHGCLRRGIAAACVTLLAVGYGARARDAALSPPLAVWWTRATDEALRSAPIQIDGVLLRDAEPGPAGQVRMLVRVRRVFAGGAWHDTAGRAQLQVGGAAAPEASAEWTSGRSVQMPATLRWPPISRNPGGADPRWQVLVRRFTLIGTVKSSAVVRVWPGRWVDEQATIVRRYVRRVLALTIGRQDATASAIVAAILIGDRAGLDPETVRRLQDAGTYHVVAISGGNVAVVIAVVLLVLRVGVRSFRIVATAAVAVVIAYWWIVGGEPSVDRAVAVALVYLLANAAGWIVDPLDALAVAVVVLLACDPLIALMPGAWLSCGATLGIIVGAKRITAALERAATLGTSWTRGLLRGMVALLAATVAAELALLPVMAMAFNRVSAAGLLLNFVAIPAMAVVQLGGLVVVATAGSPGVAPVVLWPTIWAARALVSSSRLVDVLPWLSWHVPSPAIGVVVTFYVCSAVALSDVRPIVRRLAAAAASVVLLIVLSAPTISWARPARGWLRMTAFDVGQGDSVLVQFPSGASLVVDGGPASPTFDAGERLVTPGLWASGVRRLEWLAFSHADLDHIGGIDALAAIFAPREIWEGVPVPRDPKRAALRRRAFLDGRPWRQLRTGDVLEAGEATIEVLNPLAPDWERQRVRNDDSLVLRVRYGAAELLLTGDIGEAVEAGLALHDEDRRPLRVLKVAHHGSRTSSSAAFLADYAPAVAVVSVGQSNVFGHPAPDVMARLTASHAPVFRTDHDGAVIVETDGHVVRVRTWTGRAWTVHVAPESP